MVGAHLPSLEPEVETNSAECEASQHSDHEETWELSAFPNKLAADLGSCLLFLILNSFLPLWWSLNYILSYLMTYLYT